MTLPEEFTDADHAAMREALALAQQAIGLSDPNPRVGCVITDAVGQVLGRGFTQAPGGAHAEVMAMRDAIARGHALHGAWVYVTLEPCSHHGRTPPCAQALITAGVSRVVASVQDPNPRVAGAGMLALYQAGIRTETGLLAGPASELNIGFFSRMQRGRPWVRLKVAASLDGRTALENGTSQWITGTQARSDGHAWRKRAGAVLTGIGTARRDNPRLDVRHVATARQPMRALVDTRLQIDPAARLLQPPGEVVVYTTAQTPAAQSLLARGGPNVEVVRLPAAADGKVDLHAVVADLARREVNEIHVEAGERLNAALLRASLVDEVLCYLAPLLLGPGRGMAALEPLQRLEDAVALEFTAIEPLGADLRILARPTARRTA